MRCDRTSSVSKYVTALTGSGCSAVIEGVFVLGGFVANDYRTLYQYYIMYACCSYSRYTPFALVCCSCLLLIVATKGNVCVACCGDPLLIANVSLFHTLSLSLMLLLA